MATLLLSTAGTLLGGPVGGAIGGLLGQSIDQQLLGPGPREGPRLGDLAVQTSTYGSPIPRLFGTMRVAGSIVWSTDLQEASETQGAKGQPDTITYSYSASFAVAVSSRPVSGVGRIWADGKLIRTAAGEFTVNTGFRVHTGSEDQEPDPLIASVEGIGATPAYRGLALAVFEHLELAEFGNRIPFLTFEVFADDDPVSVGTMLSDVSAGVISTPAETLLPGFAVHGRTIAAAVAGLVELLDIDLVDDGTSLTRPPANLVTPAENELGCGPAADGAARTKHVQLPARDLPSTLVLTYYDPDREYQTGLARSSAEATTWRNEALELPLVLRAEAAKGLAETCLARRWAQRDSLELHLPPQYFGIQPGALLSLAGTDQTWKITSITLDSLAVVAELRPLHSAVASLPADAGRALPSPGVAPSATTTALIELPDDGGGQAKSPIVAVAASASGARAVPLALELAGTTASSLSASTGALIGRADTELARGPSTLFDIANSVDVTLSRAEDWLEACSDSSLIAGANAALLGNEIIQFGAALPLGEGRFRLGRLLRGRWGTEWAMDLHSAGEQFVVLDRRQLKKLDIGSSHVGAKLSLIAAGLRDDPAQTTELIVAGEALRPPSPAHLRYELDGAGTLLVSWIRRSRLGWAWLDGIEVPLGSPEERYEVKISGERGRIEAVSATSGASFDWNEVRALDPAQVTITVAQVGELALSRAAVATIATL